MQQFRLMSVLVGLALPSMASASALHHEVVGESWQCVVERPDPSFDIPLNEHVVTALHFPAGIKAATRPDGWERDFDLELKGDTLLIAPHGSRRSATLSLLIETQEPAWKVHLFLRTATSPEEALKSCRFVERDALEFEQTHIDTEVQHQLGEIRAELEEQHNQRFRSKRAAMIKERLLGDRELMPKVRAMIGDHGDVTIRLGRAGWSDGEFWSAFIVENNGYRPFLLDAVQLANRNGTIIPIDDVHVDAPGRVLDIGFIEIPAGERVQGVMLLPDLARGVEPRSISFRGFTGLDLVVTSAQDPVWVWVPKREEEIEREQKDKAAFGVVTLSLQGTYGAIWLGDGIDLGKSAATSLKGLGARVTYGLSQLFAFEAEIMGATTGEAHFAGVMWNGMQGDLARSAWLGRAQFGAVLRLVHDEWYQPVVRAGVGLQGASHSAWHEVDGERREVQDVPFEWTFLFSFGAGLDLHLGPVRAGIALSGVSPWGDLGYGLARAAIEAGAHIGVRW